MLSLQSFVCRMQSVKKNPPSSSQYNSVLFQLSLVEMDLDLMGQLLTLNDRIEDMKAHNKLMTYKRGYQLKNQIKQPPLPTDSMGRNSEKALHNKYGSPSVLSLYTDCDQMLSTERLAAVQEEGDKTVVASSMKTYNDNTFPSRSKDKFNSLVARFVSKDDTLQSNMSSPPLKALQHYDGVASVRRANTIREPPMKRPPKLNKRSASVSSSRFSLPARKDLILTTQVSVPVNSRDLDTINDMTSLKVCASVPDISAACEEEDDALGYSSRVQRSHMSAQSRAEQSEQSVDSGIHVTYSTSDVETF